MIHSEKERGHGGPFPWFNFHVDKSLPLDLRHIAIKTVLNYQWDEISKIWTQVLAICFWLSIVLILLSSRTTN